MNAPVEALARGCALWLKRGAGLVRHRSSVGSVVKVDRDERVEYFALCGEEAVGHRWVGKKMAGANTWGYHHVKEDAREKSSRWATPGSGSCGS